MAAKEIGVLATLLVLVAASPYQEEIVAAVRENGGTKLLWEPGVNFGPAASAEDFQHLIGSHDIETALSALKSNCEAHCAAATGEVGLNDDDDEEKVPDNFDARSRFPQCASIGKIHDQGACKSDYAIATTSAITDRICVKSKGQVKTPISAQQVVSCCHDCGRGCKGGIPQEVWGYFVRRGISTGGAYGSNEGCQPYLIKPTGFSPNKFYGAASYATPKCRRVCYNQHYGKTKVRDDLHKGKDADRMCCCSVKPGIMKNGPATTTMLLFEDFLTYKSGVYHHVYGKRLGHTSVKVIGWGVEPKTNASYWLATNSWSEQWGDKGTFKILKDENGVEFEDYLYAADV